VLPQASPGTSGIEADPQFEPMPGRAAVTSFRNGWYPAQNLVCERAKRAAAAFDERVGFEVVDTAYRATFLECGIWDSLFIDGTEVRAGPPPSYDKVKRLIEKRGRKLQPAADHDHGLEIGYVPPEFQKLIGRGVPKVSKLYALAKLHESSEEQIQQYDPELRSFANLNGLAAIRSAQQRRHRQAQ